MTPLLAVLMVVILFIVMWLWTTNKRTQRSLDSINARLADTSETSYSNFNKLKELARLSYLDVYNTCASIGFPAIFTVKTLLTYKVPGSNETTLAFKLADYLFKQNKITEAQMMALVIFDVTKLGELIRPLQEFLRETKTVIMYGNFNEDSESIINLILLKNIVFKKNYETLSADIPQIALLTYAEISLMMMDVSYIYSNDYSRIHNSQKADEIYKSILDNHMDYQNLMNDFFYQIFEFSRIIPDDVILENYMKSLSAEVQERFPHYRTFYVAYISSLFETVPFGALIDLTTDELVVIQRLGNQGNV